MTLMPTKIIKAVQEQEQRPMISSYPLARIKSISV